MGQWNGNILYAVGEDATTRLDDDLQYRGGKSGYNQRNDQTNECRFEECIEMNGKD